MEDLVDDECGLVQFDDDPATNGSNVSSPGQTGA